MSSAAPAGCSGLAPSERYDTLTKGSVIVSAPTRSASTGVAPGAALAFGADAGFAGVMLDTRLKDGRTLLDHCDAQTLRHFLAEARAAGLFAGLAGSLRCDQIPSLLALGPDILGFRGALCGGADRRGALEASALAAVRRAIPLANPTSADAAARASLETAS